MSVRARLPEPLRFVFRSAAPAANAQEPTPGGQSLSLVGVTVYSGDSLAFGHLALSADRVTDLLNDHEEFAFVDTFVQSLDDQRGLTLRDLVITREEMHVVAVSGPRGDPRRRTRTRPIPVELRLGRYDVSGSIHAIPGTDPIGGFRRRRVMVPLTQATIEYDSPDGRVLSRFETILVNRLLADWIAPARCTDVRPPKLVPELQGRGLAKDFTSQLLVR